ncbi:hypothetical protein Tco_0555385 [Tanacetum coccineum]
MSRVTLVTPTHSQEDQPEDHLGVFSTAKVLANAAKNVYIYTRRRRAVSTGSGGVSTTSRLFSTAKESVSTVSASMPQWKRLSFDELKVLFETTMKRVQTFHPIESEGDKTVHELTTGSSKRDAKVELDHEGSKKQKTNEASGVGNHTEAYQIFADMLKKFNRDDLVKLWDLVKERFSTTEPTDDKEKELWVELKRLFKPDSDDTLWKLQRYMHDPLVWRLYDTCGVHHVSSVRGHDIFMLVEKDYPLSKGVQMLMLANKLLVEQHSEMANELLRKIFIQANKPRQ